MLRLTFFTGVLLVAFPANSFASDKDPLTIAASQTGNFGAGPRHPWHLSVNSAGKAELTIETSPQHTHREFQVPKEKLAELRRALSDESFFKLRGQYGERGTDRSAQRLTIIIGNRSQTVELFHLAHWAKGDDRAYLREAARPLRVWLLIRSWFDDATAVDSSAIDRKVVNAAKADEPKGDQENSYAKAAEQGGWLANYKRGKEMLQQLSALSPEDRKKLDIAAYRGERVALVGAAAPPGVSNDLLTADGFYLRVVNKDGKDLRPHAVWWEVLLCGKVLQVLPENKIIVLEVSERDWLVLETG